MAAATVAAAAAAAATVAVAMGGIAAPSAALGLPRVREIASAIGDIQDWAWKETLFVEPVLTWKETLGWRERTKVQKSAYITRDEGARAEEEELRGWRIQRKRGRRQRVHDVGRKADWEAVLSV